MWIALGDLFHGVLRVGPLGSSACCLLGVSEGCEVRHKPKKGV